MECRGASREARVRRAILCELKFSAGRFSLARAHIEQRERENLMVDWVTSKSVGGVSEVTLLTPIKKGLIPGELRTYVERLDAELQLVQQRIDQGIPTPVGHLPTIHFARWLILRPNQYLYCDKDYLYCDGKLLRSGDGASGDAGAQMLKVDKIDFDTLTSWLFFTSNFDGDMKTYLRDFSVVLGDDVDRIWGNCEGYPPGGSRDFDAYWAYAKQYQLTTDAFSNAYPGLSVPRIRQLAAFKDLFDAFVARTRGPDGRSVAGLPDAFDRFIADTATIPGEFPDADGSYRILLPAEGQARSRGAL